MLKARGSGGRQTRSRTAKGTPKRASAPAKVPEETKSKAGGSSPKRASAPAKVTEENKIQAGTGLAGFCMHLRLATSTGALSGVLLVAFQECLQASCCCSSACMVYIAAAEALLFMAVRYQCSDIVWMAGIKHVMFCILI